VVTKKFAGKSLENRTSGAEALSDRILYGTAEAVPFVLHFGAGPATRFPAM
jgi:hypothetical protein